MYDFELQTSIHLPIDMPLILKLKGISFSFNNSGIASQW